jgi:glutamine synthetase
MERYCKDINSESLLALNIAKQMILPGAYRYQGELANVAAAMKNAGKHPDTSSLDKVTGLVGSMEKRINELETAIGKHPHGDVLAHGKHYRDEVVPAMAEVRKVADDLETIIADDLWPLPKYSEMLFIK